MLLLKDYGTIVSKMLTNYPHGFSNLIRNDSELYGELITAVMKADWKNERDSQRQVGLNDNWGYRQLQFMWEIGRIRRFLHTQQKYGVVRCASFDGYGSREYEANDNNILLEELQNEILKKSKKFRKREREGLIGKFVNFDLDPPKNKSTVRRNINLGIKKLKKEYNIFTVLKNREI